MKDVTLWTRATDRKVLAGACVLGVVAVAALIGATIPAPGPVEGALIAAALLLLVWTGFRFVRPVRCSRKWTVAEFIAVPVIWGLLVLALGLWLHHQQRVWEEFESWRYETML